MQAKREPIENDLKLELVQVIFRHGARILNQEELSVYQFNDSSAYEAWGAGQLNNEGKKQEYGIGLFLRERYKNYLSKHYKSEEVYAYSTDTLRTKMSLELVLAGLYPPVGHAVWNPDLLWSPIPYNSMPYELDILMLQCESPRGKKLRFEAYKTEEFRKKIAKYSDFFTFLTEKTKINVNEDFMKAGYIYSVTAIDESMNLPLPVWYKPEVTEKFREIMGLVFDGFAFTLEMKKLGVGLLIKTLIENMNLKETNENPRKIYLYSGHDCNIALFTRSHNIEDFRHPDFGSSLIFEKLRDSNNQIYVRLLSRTASGTLKALKLGNYKEFCPIDDYLKIVEPVIPSDSEIDEMLGNVSVAKLKNLLFSDPVVKKLHNK